MHYAVMGGAVHYAVMAVHYAVMGGALRSNGGAAGRVTAFILFIFKNISTSLSS